MARYLRSRDLTVKTGNTGNKPVTRKRPERVRLFEYVTTVTDVTTKTYIYDGEVICGDFLQIKTNLHTLCFHR